MAHKRMFSKTIIDSDEFLEMPPTARLLYYDLGMNADDDGFVQPKRIMRMTNGNTDDLKILIAKNLVISFESDKALVIVDWHINNTIRQDRYTATIFTEYKRLLMKGKNKRLLPRKVKKSTVGLPLVNQLATVGLPVVCIEEERIGKNRIEKNSDVFFQTFYSAYPKKVDKKKTEIKFNKLLEEGVDENIIIEGAERFAKVCKKKGTEKQFIRSPLVWLNNENWEDELEDDEITFPPYPSEKSVPEITLEEVQNIYDEAKQVECVIVDGTHTAEEISMERIKTHCEKLYTPETRDPENEQYYLKPEYQSFYRGLISLIKK